MVTQFTHPIFSLRWTWYIPKHFLNNRSTWINQLFMGDPTEHGWTHLSTQSALYWDHPSHLYYQSFQKYCKVFNKDGMGDPGWVDTVGLPILGGFNHDRWVHPLWPMIWMGLVPLILNTLQYLMSLQFSWKKEFNKSSSTFSYKCCCHIVTVKFPVYSK